MGVIAVAAANDCIRCSDAPACTEEGYCGHCYWAAKGEAADGFHSLLEYLNGWRLFAEWCEQNEAKTR